MALRHTICANPVFRTIARVIARRLFTFRTAALSTRRSELVKVKSRPARGRPLAPAVRARRKWRLGTRNALDETATSQPRASGLRNICSQSMQMCARPDWRIGSKGVRRARPIRLFGWNWKCKLINAFGSLHLAVARLASRVLRLPVRPIRPVRPNRLGQPAAFPGSALLSRNNTRASFACSLGLVHSESARRAQNSNPNSVR